jgi:hypothetical protein
MRPMELFKECRGAKALGSFFALHVFFVVEMMRVSRPYISKLQQPIRIGIDPLIASF